MEWFERFALEGLILPALMIALGSLIILRASSTPTATPEQIAAAPKLVRWFANKNSAKLQRRGGWGIIGAALLIALLRLTAT